VINYSATIVRMCTYRDISDADIEAAIAAACETMGGK